MSNFEINYACKFLASKSHADDAHWNYFYALFKTNCWYNCNIKNYTWSNGKRKCLACRFRLQHAFHRLTRFMLAFIKTKGHKNESKLFKCLENAKTFFWSYFSFDFCLLTWTFLSNHDRLRSIILIYPLLIFATELRMEWLSTLYVCENSFVMLIFAYGFTLSILHGKFCTLLSSLWIQDMFCLLS